MHVEQTWPDGPIITSLDRVQGDIHSRGICRGPSLVGSQSGMADLPDWPELAGKEGGVYYVRLSSCLGLS